MSDTGIRTGMTREEVTDLIGPPLDSLRMDLMFGGPSTTVSTFSHEDASSVERPGPAAGRACWLGCCGVARTTPTITE